ncbi:MAG: AbrB/MazE/SpoVT family DNA-binding domain-containing protein [Chloroflexi bacterium]|nr:AbrB/MazE/SpoVT family DNA-binding domain-containing protein [Chloroflexota bacterium]MCL5275697.1 AbrB/MazE/SpoVT family DNA-binding domain-containing protein [Chloroflexota bacterium]
MSQRLETTKVQERGVVTLPRRVREKLGIKKGSTIAFIETDEGRIEVRALEADAMAALDEIGAALKEQGVTLEQMIEDGRTIRKRLYDERYAKPSR